MARPAEGKARINWKEFGATVAELRQQCGLTQEQLAASIGRTASWVSQVERGVLPVNRLDVLSALADGLDVSVTDLRVDMPSVLTNHGVGSAENDSNLVAGEDDFRPAGVGFVVRCSAANNEIVQFPLLGWVRRERWLPVVWQANGLCAVSSPDASVEMLALRPASDAANAEQQLLNDPGGG